MSIKLTDQEYELISSAIKKVEKKTSVEIFAVLANRSDDYRFVGMFYFSFWILVCSVFLAFWMMYQSIVVSLFEFTLAQLAAFMCAFFLLKIFPNLAIVFVPRRIKHERSHLNASKQFLAHGIHNTSGRTGLLVFVSLQERYAEILVDTAIEETIGREYWFDIVGELTDACKAGNICQGYVDVIEKSGERLSKDFAANNKTKNELQDKLVVI